MATSAHNLEKLMTSPKATLATLSTSDIAEIVQLSMDAFHTDQEPPLSDDIYDMVRDELKRRDAKHPLLKKVGASIPNMDGTRKVELPYWMGSLDKIKADVKVLDRWIAKYPGPYVLSDKLDGISALLMSDAEGKPTHLYTRGDGHIGQDVSHLIKHLQNIPPKLSASVAVRGELIIPAQIFATHLRQRGANPRNLVAGTVNAKTPDQQVLKYVQFVPYSLVSAAKKMAPSEQKRAMAAMFGGTHYHTVYSQAVKDKELNVQVLSDVLLHRRKASPYEIDGIVVEQDAIHASIKGKNPSYAFAFKSILTNDTAEVIVTNVEWNVSKDGYLKPVVEFDPVPLSGVNIKRATGFNAGYIKANIIGPGARILIVRSGDVIPKIIEVLKPAAAGMAQMPEGARWNDTGVDLLVADAGDNEELELKRIENFIIKLGVHGMGPGIVRKLATEGKATSLSKLLAMTEKDMAIVLGETTAKKVKGALDERLMAIDCIKVMEASNQFGRGFGEKRLKTIVASFPELGFNPKFVPSMAQLMQVEGVQQISAEHFLEGLPKFWAFVKEHGFDKYICKKAAAAATAASTTSGVAVPKTLQGFVVVFTGFRNNSLKDYIEARGGQVSSALSRKTTHLVAKTTDSTKIKNAEKMENLKIMSLDQFLKAHAPDF